MKNILVFSAATGGGHNQVAGSLGMELKELGYNVVKIEPFREKSKVLDLFISDGYKVLATKMPKVYGGIYKVSNIESVNKSLSKATVATLSKAIYKTIQEYKPEMVISTHALFVNVLADLKAKGMIDIPFVSFVTDFIAHQSYINKNVDAYVVGGDCTKESLTAKGISEKKIFTYGIPIRREFHNTENQEINTNKKFSILLMGGSMGVSGIKKVVKELLGSGMRLKITVVCGNNNILKKSLSDKYTKDVVKGNLEIYGFTKEIPKLMDCCDVIITKPGGLTTSESIAKNVPMIIPFFIPGQEQENAEFLAEAGGAVLIKKIDEINGVIESLIKKPDELNNMRQKLKELSKKQSLDNMVKLIDNIINSKEEYVII